MFPNLRSYHVRLIFVFTTICLLVGLLSLGVGISIVNQGVIIEVTNRVRQDLNAAWAIFRAPVEKMKPVFALAADDSLMRDSISDGSAQAIAEKLREIRDALDLDFAAGLLLGGDPLQVNYDGSTLPVPEDKTDFRFLAAEQSIRISGVAVLDQGFLLREDPVLAERAVTPIVKTPRAEIRPETEETRGMTLVCATPVLSEGVVSAVLYGGILINGNSELIDRIRDVIFHLKAYDDLELGTATVFLEDVRIATNVVDADGRRAIGTQVSQEVKDQVLGEGLRWSDRAFVVNRWYRTAYDPILDVYGRRVGMLYVGVLEAKYRDFRVRAFVFYILIIAGGIAAAGAAAHLFARLILRPVNRLINASREVAEGHLEPDIGPKSDTEIGLLQNTFSNMLAAFREQVQRQEEESSAKLMQSERQAIVGRLAAGVAHEVNNPLTSVLTFTHLLLERDDLPEDAVKDLRAIAESTERVRKIVRGLLDYSRREALQRVETNLNELIESTLLLLGNQMAKANIQLEFETADDLPPITIDRNQTQSVLVNLLLNAADAIEGGGRIMISTAAGISSTGYRYVEVSVTDTGTGISPENMENLFDPFFTTKEAGKGTGLGLAVSKNIIDRHGGSIRVNSTPGEGSTFTMRLPLEGSSGETAGDTV